MLERVKRQKLGRPRMEPQLGSEPDDVDVLLEERERVVPNDDDAVDGGGDGGGGASSPGPAAPCGDAAGGGAGGSRGRPTTECDLLNKKSFFCW